MRSILGRFLLLLLLVLPTTIMVFETGNKMAVYAAEDVMEGEEDGEDDDEATVADEGEEGTAEEGDQAVVDADKGEEEEDDDEDSQIKPSQDADTNILFTRPINSNDLPSGQVVRFIVGFKNNGDKEFTVTSLETSFRYPQDYSFYIQNFTAAVYNQVVEPKKEASFEYGFTPSESFNSRPFGLTILLNYVDSEGGVYQSACFNETINVVEPDEGLDGETFFLYVFLAAIFVLVLFGLQQLFKTYGKKHLGKGKAPQRIEMGTQNTHVDYSWLPQETLNAMNKSPKGSPRGSGSPRKRKSKRGSGEE